MLDIQGFSMLSEREYMEINGGNKIKDAGVEAGRWLAGAVHCAIDFANGFIDGFMSAF